jgi:hypothetical protein
MFGSQLLRHAKKAATAALAATLATFSFSAQANTTLTGQIQGTPISNARFVALDRKGKITLQGFTTQAGKFSYKAGNTVSFFVGDILLGSTAGAARVTTSSLVASAKSADAFSNLTRFLQAVDSDRNVLNGVQVASTTHTYAKGLKVNFDAAMKTFEVQAALLKVLSLASGTPTLPQAVDALTNFRMALLNAYNTSGQPTVLNLLNILGHISMGHHTLTKRANGTCGGNNLALRMALYENDSAFYCANACNFNQLNTSVSLKFPVAHEATLVHEPGSNIITVIHHYTGRNVIETMVKQP